MTDQQTLNARDLGDSFAVALLQWPALIGAMSLGQEGWALALRIVLGTWVALVALGLIFGRKEGPRWGLAMSLAAGCIAALWLTHGTLWSLVWFALAMISFHAAIRVRITETLPPETPPAAPAMQ